MSINISLMQFLTFSSTVSTSAKYNYVSRQKNIDVYHQSYDYWREFRKAIHKLPANGGSLSVSDQSVDKVRAERKENYTQSISNFNNFVKGKDVQFFNVGRSRWTMEEELVVNASPDVGMIIDGRRYFVKVFPNVKNKKTKLNARSSKSILTLMQEANSEFDTSTGTFAVLRINSPHLFSAEPINRRDAQLLRLDAKNFVNYWHAA